MSLPIIEYTETGRPLASWIKDSGRSKYCELGGIIKADDYIQKYLTERTSVKDEEIERMKLRAANDKSALEHASNDMRMQVKAVERDAGMTVKKRLTALRRELMEKEERLFLDSMNLDVELEKRIKEFISGEKSSCDIKRYKE